jgi:hypothetical protein
MIKDKTKKKKLKKLKKKPQVNLTIPWPRIWDRDNPTKKDRKKKTKLKAQQPNMKGWNKKN